MGKTLTTGFWQLSAGVFISALNIYLMVAGHPLGIIHLFIFVFGLDCIIIGLIKFTMAMLVSVMKGKDKKDGGPL